MLMMIRNKYKQKNENKKKFMHVIIIKKRHSTQNQVLCNL